MLISNLPFFWRPVPNAALKLALPDKLILSQDVSNFHLSIIIISPFVGKRKLVNFSRFPN